MKECFISSGVSGTYFTVASIERTFANEFSESLIDA